MNKRRIEIRGEGSIKEVERGRVYRIRLRLPPAEPGGTRRWSPMRTVRGNKAKARQEIEKYRLELEAELNGESTGITVAEYARGFQDSRAEQNASELKAVAEGKAAKTTLSPDTVARDEIETRRIEDLFSGVRIEELDATTIEKAYAGLRKEGLSPSAIHKVHRKLSQVLKHARKNGLIAANPCDEIEGVTRPKAKERKSLSIEQAVKLASDLKSSKRNGCIVAVWLALATGGRRGEILGLTWGDIDLDKKHIYFREQLDRSKNRRDPKSPKSQRNLAINDGDVRFLTEWRAIVSSEFYNGGSVPEDSPVCTNKSGTWLEPNFFGKWRRNYFADHGLGRFEKVEEYTDRNGQKRCRKSGYRGFNLHELRHTQATLLIGSGADIKTVQNRLGHASASLTMNIYAHAIEQNDQQAANTIGNLLESKRRS